MQTSSALPTRTPTPFANSGAKNTIPVASQISVTPGAASYTDGFPPLTRTPIAAGGVPPSGLDFNGIFNAITTAVRWSNAGGQYPYDATFSTAVGGYPKGAILARSGFDGFWVSTTENNTTNPDAAGAGWNMLSAQGWDYVVGTGSANIYTATYLPAILALKDGLTLHSTAIAANTGASTFSPNGLTAKPILSLGQAALIGGELVVNGRFSVRYSATLDSWILISASGGNAMSGRLLSIKTFTASGTYTPTTGTNFIKVRLVGGGGAGAGAPTTSSSQAALGGAGSSGSYCEALITSSFSGLTVTVGSAGAGASGSNGGAGGASSFGSIATAPGGLGGANSYTTGGTVQLAASPPAAGTGGYINARGNAGSPTISTSINSGGIGFGGASQLGSGGYGSGGNGSFNVASSSAQVGVSGTGGIVIVEEYA